MLRTLAIFFGVVFVFFGIAGFIPTFDFHGRLFDLFRVNFEHNIAHLATGVLAILCGLSSGFASKMFFIIAGILYIFLAIMGFREGDGRLFQMIAVNAADNYFHLGFGTISVLLGFCLKY